MSSLVTGRSNPLPRSFFFTDPWEEENGRARGAESLSEKKANHERREAKLKQISMFSLYDFDKRVNTCSLLLSDKQVSEA